MQVKVQWSGWAPLGKGGGVDSVGDVPLALLVIPSRAELLCRILLRERAVEVYAAGGHPPGKGCRVGADGHVPALRLPVEASSEHLRLFLVIKRAVEHHAIGQEPPAKGRHVDALCWDVPAPALRVPLRAELTHLARLLEGHVQRGAGGHGRGLWGGGRRRGRLTLVGRFVAALGRALVAGCG